MEEKITEEDIIDIPEESIIEVPEEEPAETQGRYDIMKTRFNGLKSAYKGDLKQAMFQLCFENNIFYDETLLNSFIKAGDDSTIEKLPEIYVWSIEGDKKYEGLTFFSQIKKENFVKIYSESLSLLTLSDDDKKNRQQIINIVGYDPFASDPENERPQMYRDLTGLLTDSMRKDIAKQKAAIEIVRNYANIARYQLRMNMLLSSEKTDADTQEQIDGLLTIINKIQANINQTTKENGFTSGKGVGSGGRGMLSDVMMQCEELGYDKGITNYYDIETSKAIEEIATISWKAMLDQVKFSATDYADILAGQSDLVRKSVRIAKDATEALRLCREKLTKQELIEELANEYRKKGIKEDEINEFISREYELYDGKN